MIVTVTLPWPPSLNRYWRTVRRGPRAGTVYVSDDGKDFQSRVIALVETMGSPIITVPCSLTMEAHPPIYLDNGSLASPRRPLYDADGTMTYRGHNWRDIDSLEKASLDALTKARVIADDSLFDEMHVYRKPANDPGMLIISIGVLA